jgi:drug/metabolite transporter (DMT)-like permease
VAIGLICAFMAAVLYGVAAVLQAEAARRVPSTDGLDPLVLVRMLRYPPAIAALVLLLAGFGLHLVAVRLLPLFLAQSGIAVSLVVSAVIAVVVFDEHLDPLGWFAVGSVFVGLMLMSASAGQIGGAGPPGLSVPLIVAIAVIAVLAWPAARRRTTASAAMLGAAGFASRHRRDRGSACPVGPRSASARPWRMLLLSGCSRSSSTRWPQRGPSQSSPPR